MKVIAAGIAAFALMSGALGQNTSQTFHITTVSTVAALREVGVILRTLSDETVDVDETNNSITVKGTDDTLALSKWLVEQLDTQNPPASPAHYTVAGSPQDSVRIFYLAHMPTQAELNECVTLLRTVGDIQRIFTYSQSHAIAMRTTEANAQLAEWLVGQLDTDKPPTSTAHYTVAGSPQNSVRIFYTAHMPLQAEMNACVTLLRTIGEIQRIFTYSQSHAIAIRTTESGAQLAEWLVGQLDTDKPSTSTAHYTVAGSPQDSVRIFYMAHMRLQAELNECVTLFRTVGDIKQVFADTEPHAIAIRTTDSQAQLAEWIFQQLDSEKPPPSPAHYTVPGSPQDAVRIFYLAHTPEQFELNEFVTTLRTVGDIQRIFTFSRSRAIALRTTDTKAQLAEWLVGQMDVAPEAKVSTGRHPFALNECADGLVEVAFVPRILPQKDLNALVNTLRSGADIRYIFTHTGAPQSIAFRGCPEQVETADRLFREANP